MVTEQDWKWFSNQLIERNKHQSGTVVRGHRLFVLLDTNVGTYTLVSIFLWNLALLATFLYYFSASINPFIYTFTNGAFRKQFQNLLCCHREKVRDLRNVAALINEKEIAKHEGEANVQVL